MIVPTVDDMFSAAPSPTRALCVLERNVTEFLWNGGESNRRHPMMDGASLAQQHVKGQVRLIPKKDKPRTIGGARPITLQNADTRLTPTCLHGG